MRNWCAWGLATLAPQDGVSLGLRLWLDLSLTLASSCRISQHPLQKIFASVLFAGKVTRRSSFSPLIVVGGPISSVPFKTVLFFRFVNSIDADCISTHSLLSQGFSKLW